MMRPATPLMSSCLFPFMSLGVRRSGSTGIPVWVHWETRLVTGQQRRAGFGFLGRVILCVSWFFFIAMAGFAGAEGGTGSNGQAGGGHGWWIAFTSASFFLHRIFLREQGACPLRLDDDTLEFQSRQPGSFALAITATFFRASEPGRGNLERRRRKETGGCLVVHGMD